MKQVDVGDYIGANNFDLFPELYLTGANNPEHRFSAETIQAAGYVGCYNALVGNADASLLLPVAYELHENNLDAGAFLLQAQVELAQAGCALPQPLFDIDYKPDRFELQPGGKWRELRNEAMEFMWYTRGKRQTEAFMPFARSRLAHRRLQIARPHRMTSSPDLSGTPMPPEIREAKTRAARHYEANKVTYWEQACLKVAYTTSSRGRPDIHRRNLGAFWTGELDTTQLSIVLDAANPHVDISLLPKPSLARRIAGTAGVSDLFLPYDKGPIRPRRSLHVMQEQARQAVALYAKSTRNYGAVRINEEDILRSTLIAEADRFRLLGGFLPNRMPNAAAINNERARRVATMGRMLGYRLQYLPIDVQKVCAYAERHYD